RRATSGAGRAACGSAPASTQAWPSSSVASSASTASGASRATSSERVASEGSAASGGRRPATATNGPHRPAVACSARARSRRGASGRRRVPAGLRDDGRRDEEAEAAAAVLGGEEGVEDAVAVLGLDAGAGVRDLDDAPRLSAVPLVPRLHLDGPAPSRRLDGVQ